MSACCTGAKFSCWRKNKQTNKQKTALNMIQPCHKMLSRGFVYTRTKCSFILRQRKNLCPSTWTIKITLTKCYYRDIHSDFQMDNFCWCKQILFVECDKYIHANSQIHGLSNTPQRQSLPNLLYQSIFVAKTEPQRVMVKSWILMNESCTLCICHPPQLPLWCGCSTSLKVQCERFSGI